LDENGKIKEKVYFSRFVLNQDKGSAIEGPGRVDLFCGFGIEAENMAGTLEENGELYLLLKK
jgi:membrane-bound lytic murein transglycosylase A